MVKAGATMEEDTGEIKVNSETVIVAAHLFLDGQFLGFSGSSGPSHVTYTACQNQRRAIVYALVDLPAFPRDETWSIAMSSSSQALTLAVGLSRGPHLARSQSRLLPPGWYRPWRPPTRNHLSGKGRHPRDCDTPRCHRGISQSEHGPTLPRRGLVCIFVLT